MYVQLTPQTVRRQLRESNRHRLDAKFSDCLWFSVVKKVVLSGPIWGILKMNRTQELLKIYPKILGLGLNMDQVIATHIMWIGL